MKIEVHGPDYLSEKDRATVTANGIVIDVIANEDDTVYVEMYAYERGHQAVVQHYSIDAYKYPHPNLTLGLADKPR